MAARWILDSEDEQGHLGDRELAGIPDYSDEQWTELLERLTLHADGKLRKLHWRGLSAKRGGTALGGICAEDLAADAITDWIDGKREWNPEAYPDVLSFLKGVVDSKVSHLVQGLENKMSQRIVADETGKQPAEMSSCPRPGPEAIVAGQEELERLRAAMIAGVKEDKLAAAVFECLEADYTRPSEIAEILGVAVTDVNNAQKRLRRIADKVYAKKRKAKK